MSQENLNQQQHHIHSQQPIVIHHNGSFSPSINNEQANNLLLTNTKQDEQHANHLPQGVSIVNVANKVDLNTNTTSQQQHTSSVSLNSANLTESINTNLSNKVIIPESGDETEEENEEVEHSPGGRWSKRNQSVTQRDVPGIDKAYLAMDTENGYEVVWNEINISSGKKFKNNNNFNNDENKIDEIFRSLIKLNHPNIVKFHHYWIDKNEKELKRIIFITEYMSSGSLKQFLRKAKKNKSTHQEANVETMDYSTFSSIALLTQF